MIHNPIDVRKWLFELEDSHLILSTHRLVEKMQTALQQNDLPNMWQTYNLLIAICKTFDDPLEQAETILECALIIYQLGDLQKTIELLKEAEQLYGKNKHYAAVVRWMIGCVQWRLAGERLHAYESWNQCLHLFTLLQSCSVNQEQAQWYSERIREIHTAFEEKLNDETVSPATTTQAKPPAQEEPGQPAADRENGQYTPQDELNSLIMQLFPVVDAIPAGGFGPVGYRPYTIGEVDIDRVIIQNQVYRMVNLRSSGKAVSLPPNKYVVVKITGDSMNKPGKLSEEAVDIGDYVLLRMQDIADDGDMIAAEIDNEDSYATLKRFRIVESGLKYILEPQSTNPVHQPREFTVINEGFHIRGVALVVFKPIEKINSNDPIHP